MTYARLQWLFPVAVTLHNGEEAIWMPPWALAHGAQLPISPPSAEWIRLLLVLVTIAAYVATYLSWRRGPCW